MDPLSRHEIYIPKDAEVKRIALQSLPRSLLTGMGLSVSDSNASRMPLDSPEGIWICPAVLRPKGQKLPSDTGNSLLENVSRLAKKSQASPEPVQMSFVSSNRAARKALQDTLSGVNISADPPTGSDLPPGSAPQTYQIAVVIYHGRIYLSIRKPSQSQRQGETALTAARSAAPSTSSSSQRKRTAPEAPPKAAGKKTPKKRVRIPLPPGSLKLMKNLTLKASSVTQELLRGSRSERIQTQSKETQDGKNTSQTSPSVPKPSDRAHRVDKQSQSHVGAEQTPDEAAGWRSPGLSEAEGGEAPNTSQNGMMHTNPLTESRDQSWTSRESQSSSLQQQQQQQQCDYKELEQEEKIAQIKAKLRLKEAALKNLKK